MARSPEGAAQASGRVVFRAPGPRAQSPEHEAALLDLSEDEPSPLRASAYYFTAPIYAKPSTESASFGLARRGGSVQIKARATGSECEGGSWYSVVPTGYICTRAGFRTPRAELGEGAPEEAPDLSRALPYAYAKLVRQGAPRMNDVPSRDAWAAYEAARTAADSSGEPLKGKVLSEVAREELRGAYFFAMRGDAVEQGDEWVRTVRGKVLPRDAIESVTPSSLRGVHLPTAQEFAFVTTPDAAVLREGDLSSLGVADRYARFPFLGTHTEAGRTFVRGPGGALVAREDVRLARITKPPPEVPDGARWLHVNLGEQVLMAYEGNRPVFATLIATGVPGHRTPTGLFRIGAKHATTTMRGPDPDHGVYEVQEVPWTQFFSGNYALHGAYWHDGFGAVRSHGCVNVAPRDARWLFDWTTPELPEGWHGIRGRTAGTWVYVTN